MGIRLLSAAFALAFASAAFAQTPSVTLRGTIETVSADGGALTMKTRAGEAATVRVKHGVNGLGKKLHYYLNYSSDEQSVPYSYGTGIDLTTGAAVASAQTLQLKPWDLAVIEER